MFEVIRREVVDAEFCDTSRQPSNVVLQGTRKLAQGLVLNAIQPEKKGQPLLWKPKFSVSAVSITYPAKMIG